MIDKIKLKQLSEKMTDLDLMKDSLSKKKAYFQESIKNDVDLISKKKIEVEELMKSIEPEAISEYEKTGKKSKTLTGGIKIRTSTVKTINYPAEKALQLAKEKGMFLQLDKKSFDAAAPGLITDPNIDWITIDTKYINKVSWPKEIKIDS